MPLKAVFFDFNGVLVDDEPLHWELLNEALEPYGIRVSFQEYKDRLLGFDDKGALQALLHNKADAPSEASIEALIAKKADRYAELAPVSVRPFKETLRFLESIPCTIVRGVVSGALRPEIEAFLERYGLKGDFQFLVATEDTQQSKPDPACYQKAYEQAKALTFQQRLSPEECLAIEDSSEGISSAKGAGLRTLGLLHTYPANRLRAAEWVLAHLGGFGFFEIEGLFERLKAKK
jgi:HAD superfamily hydrolase (TIGR01509 family)